MFVWPLCQTRLRTLCLKRAQKLEFTGEAASCKVGRWTQRIFNWKPWFRVLPDRQVRRLRKRWEDDVVAMAGENLTEAAIDAGLWTALASGYVSSLS